MSWSTNLRIQNDLQIPNCEQRESQGSHELRHFKTRGSCYRRSLAQPDLHRLAGKIVEAERRVGHKKLADQLEAILKQPRPRANGNSPPAVAATRLHELPISRRHGESLDTFLRPEKLQHHMVLPAATEERFTRIENEYAARDRLGVFGLRPQNHPPLRPSGCRKSLGANRIA